MGLRQYVQLPDTKVLSDEAEIMKAIERIPGQYENVLGRMCRFDVSVILR
jgi:hypothetical protein